MKTQWNQNEPIEIFFHQNEEVVEQVQHGDAPFTNAQVLNTVFIIMAQAKTFKDTCKEQQKKSINEKIQPNFKNHFF